MAIVTYPLNGIQYQAEDAELFHCTRTSGVYTNEDFNCSVTGADNVVNIGLGIGWIQNSRFSGKVIALKESTNVDIGISDSVYPRIDAIVIRFNVDTNGTEILVKNGNPESSPIPPEVERTEYLYELHLYHIRREAGATVVTAADITDVRLDPNYCGIMADSVTMVDTAAISAQVNSLVEALRSEIASVSIDGINSLLKSGPLILSPNQYGSELPENPANGQFFVLIKE